MELKELEISLNNEFMLISNLIFQTEILKFVTICNLSIQSGLTDTDYKAYLNMGVMSNRNLFLCLYFFSFINMNIKEIIAQMITPIS